MKLLAILAPAAGLSAQTLLESQSFQHSIAVSQ